MLTTINTTIITIFFLPVCSYLEHGAEIITTSSYQASIPGFQKHLGISEEEAKELLKLSVELAKKAREEYILNSGSMFSFIFL